MLHTLWMLLFSPFILSPFRQQSWMWQILLNYFLSWHKKRFWNPQIIGAKNECYSGGGSKSYSPQTEKTSSISYFLSSIYSSIKRHVEKYVYLFSCLSTTSTTVWLHNCMAQTQNAVIYIYLYYTYLCT